MNSGQKWLLAAALAVVGVPVYAESPEQRPSVTLTVTGCGVDKGDIELAFSFEIPVRFVEAPEEAAAKVTIVCTGDDVEVTIEDALTRKAVRRSHRIPIRDPDRNRTLALTSTELLTASWAELGMEKKKTPAAQSPAPEPRAAAVARESAREIAVARIDKPRRWQWRAGVSGGGRTLTGTFGVELALEAGIEFDRFGVAITALGARGEDDVADGAVSQTAFDGQVTALVDTDRFGPRLVAGVGARVGVMTLSGRPTAPTVRGDSLTGPTLSPVVRLGAELDLGPTRLGLTTEAGVHLWHIEGQSSGMPVTTADGPWVGVRLGVGL